MSALPGIVRQEEVKPCRVITVSESGWGRIPYWRAVSPGYSNGGLFVVYAIPSPCIVTPATRIYRVKRCRYRSERLKRNVVVWEDCGGGETPYVYPAKVYDQVMNLYIKPILEGRRPLNNGILLVGAPGVGKSKLAEILVRMVGFNVFKVRPDEILSKWVGESEQNIAKLFREARAAEPSAVIMDDAEWLISSRKLAATDEAMSMVNIQNIIFDEMQAVYNEGRRILFIATTNIKPSEIDPALLRYGRFGHPIFVPIPDYEALEYVLKWKVRDEEKAKKLAWLAVNMGLSMADALTLAELVQAGVGDAFKSRSGRGYARVDAIRIPGFERLLDEMIPRDAFERRSRIYVPGNPDVAAAFAVQLAYAAGKTVIKITDNRHIDEAVHSAGFLGSVIIADTILPPESQVYIYDNHDGPVFYVGRDPPVKPAYRLAPPAQIAAARSLQMQMILAVAVYKGIKIDKEIVRKAANAASSSEVLDRLLSLMAVLSTLNESIINQAKYNVHAEAVSRSL